MSDQPISELVRHILERRGLSARDDIESFLSPDYVLHTHDPLHLHDMPTAVARILQAIEKNERICVYADFDCDGIPGASILSDFFKKIKYENIEVYLPHRDREGYGFHISAIEKLALREVKLIITVDVGMTAVESVARANELGIDVIITDHHEPIPVPPEAYAIVNPKLGTYPFPHLCGAGVAFKLVQALIFEGKKNNIEAFVAIPLGWEKWLLDLVAIATVADMVPLVGENRTLAFWGLTVLRKSPRVGIIALCRALRIQRHELTEDDIGFGIAPRINAASRMDEPEHALRLLTTTDVIEAERIVVRLEELNAKRKGIVASMVREARKRVKARFTPNDQLIVLGDPEWKPALLGLAANSIMDDRGGIVCLWGRDANGNLKGSCRSDGVVGLSDLFLHGRELFIECGGHNASGGFSVSHDRVHTLAEDLGKVAASLRDAAANSLPVSSVAPHDGLLTLRELSWSLLVDVAHLSPFGMGNTKPVFCISRVMVTAIKRFGKEKNHVEIMLADRDGTSARAFNFFCSPQDFSHTPVVGAVVTILATLERDSYRGYQKFALRIVDVLPAE